MKLFQIVFISIIFIFNYSCKQNKSEVNQVNIRRWICDKNIDKANYYYNTYAKGNSKITANYKSVDDESGASLIKETFQKLSNVPEEYLKYAFRTYDTKVNIISRRTKERFNGLTQSGYTDSGGRYPVAILYSENVVVAHEFGHVTEGYFWTDHPDFKSDLTRVANSLPHEKKSAYLRLYTNLAQQSKDSETFAEIFDTWYCSQEARISLKYCLPSAFNFAKKYLLLPDNTSDNIEQDVKPMKDMDTIVRASIETRPSSVCTFDKNSNELISIQDRHTGKIWSNYKVERMDWIEAREYCRKLNIKNRSFRLPTFQELQLFHHHGCFKFKVSEPLWSSSTPDMRLPSFYTFIVDSNGSISYKNSPSQEKHSFICVTDDCDFKQEDFAP